ncbi:DNA-binding response regulator [Clostridia bacterium]|nr:DNA-binding response regulator [Clostridia bacterium]GHV27232.1 DNA-binding response regulator [Clostridia bacterium]
MRVLVVEDEPRLAQALEQILKGQKIQSDVVYNGRDGLDYAKLGQYDLILLDVMLPGMNGFDVARQLRQDKVSTPILMLTARDEVSSKVRGLDCGADDYMTKPFASDELLARVRAMTRRRGEVILETCDFADLTLNISTNTLQCGTRSVKLGFKEFEIIKLLIAGGEAITPKEELITRVWGADSSAEDNNVEAYISFIRKKLHYLGSAVGVETVRKVGYRLEAQTV